MKNTLENKLLYLSFLFIVGFQFPSSNANEASKLAVFNTNYMVNWDGGGATGTGSMPNNFGWSCSPSITWAEANVFGVRYQDDQSYLYNGSALSGRILFVRWDGVGGTSTSSKFSYPATLKSCKTYEFTAKIAWHANASAPTFSYAIQSEKDNSGIALVKDILEVSATGSFQEMKLVFSVPETGTYYLTLGASTAVLGAIRDLSVVEYNAEPFINVSTNKLTYNSTTLEQTFSINAYGLTENISFSGPDGVNFTPSFISPEQAKCGIKVTAAFNSESALTDGEISVTSGALTKIIEVKNVLPPYIAEGTDIITSDGTWCWFQDPRAVYYEESKQQTYTGWINSKGKVQVASYNHKTGAILTNTISPNDFMQVDDHNNPTFLMRKDGHILASYSGHFYGPMRVIVSKNPEDISSFGAEANFGSNVTYANPYQIGDSIVMFYRDGKTWHPTMNVSKDGGKSWGTPQEFITRNGSQQRPYAKYTQDSKGGMHITFTTGHPRVEARNKIYYVYYLNHKFYKADGTFIKNYNSAADALNIDLGEAEVVYDASSGKGWTWDIALDDTGKPVILFTAFPDDENHHYYYSSWDGDKWVSNHIVNSGRWFPQTVEGGTEAEPNYSGGMVLDPENPSTVYLSKQVDGIFEIFKYTTTDEGATWETSAITANSPSDVINVRPIIPKGHKPGSFDVVWLRGKYVTYANYLTSVMYYSPNKLNTNLDSITVNGTKMDAFNTEKSSFTIKVQNGETAIPEILGFSSVPFANITVKQASEIPGKAIITVVTEGSAKTKIYEINIVKSDDTSLDDNLNDSFFLYPNPTDNIIHGDLSEYPMIKTILIVDLNGSVVYKQLHTQYEKLFSIDVHHLNTGMYMVKLFDTNNQTVASNPFVKK